MAESVKSLPYIRVINIQQPVETHVHAERDVDQIVVFLLQAIINSGQTINDLQNVHGLIVLLEVVLVQSITCRRQAQEIHCKSHIKSQVIPRGKSSFHSFSLSLENPGRVVSYSFSEHQTQTLPSF